MATRISNIFPFLLITLFCVGGVEGFYLGVEKLILDPAKTVEPAIKPAAGVEEVTKMKSVKRQRDYSIITRRNLFGPPPQSQQTTNKQEPVPQEELEATTLDVVLMGTIGGGEENSRAIILNKKDRKQEIYQVGDSVQGASIKEIRRGKVILSLNDKDQMLDMSEASKYAPRSARPTSVSPAARQRRVVPAPIPGGESVTGSKQPVKTRVVRPTRRIVRPKRTVQESVEDELSEQAGEQE